MAGSKALIVAMQVVAVLAAVSGAFAQGEFGLSPAPAPGPDQGAGIGLQISTAAVASAVVVSLFALMKN